MTVKEMVFEFPGLVARVTRPVLTEQERTRRMKTIHRESENLLRRKKDARRYQ